MRQGVTRKRGRNGDFQSAGAPNDVHHQVVSHDARDEERSFACRRFLVMQGPRCMQPPLLGLIFILFLSSMLVLLARNSNQASSTLQAFPRCIRYQHDTLERPPIVRHLEDDLQLLPSNRIIHVPERAKQAQKHLENSKDYKRRLADPIETNHCKAQYDWQLSSFPTCNLVHEVADLTNLLYSHKRKSGKQIRLIGNGYYRDVWTVRQQESWNKTNIVIKTLRYAHDYTLRNYDRHRRDAIVMDRLSQSQHILDIYGYCANSGLFEYAGGGTVSRLLVADRRNARNVTLLQKIHVASQLATALAELHNVDREGRASIAHTDITAGQFVKVNGIYKLNDFNRARLLLWDNKNDKPCGYYVANNPGMNRSPEEYHYEKQSEKVDVYSLGNIFYFMLTKQWPWEGFDEEEAMKRVKDGGRPEIPLSIQKSNDPDVKTLLEAIIMSQKQDPKERATAREVEKFLKQNLRRLDERLQSKKLNW